MLTDAFRLPRGLTLRRRKLQSGASKSAIYSGSLQALMAQAHHILPSLAFLSAHSTKFLPRHRLQLGSSLRAFTVNKRLLGLVRCQDRDVHRRTSKISVDDEYSEGANEDLLLFLLQLDLATRLQRALNQDHFDAAQMIREKINEVDNEVARRRDMKVGTLSAKAEAQDREITLLRLRSELTKAVENEDYAGAVRLRDQISKAEAESLAASAKALIYQNVKYAFRLGQKIKHKLLGYRGVICGMDPVCSESNDWVKAAGVDELPRGRTQPFYQVLVDVQRDAEALVTYVAEDNLEAPLEPDLDPLRHPYVFFLFYGMDAVGDYIPAKQLKFKYEVPRQSE